jgi:hypothetical protein
VREAERNEPPYPPTYWRLSRVYRVDIAPPGTEWDILGLPSNPGITIAGALLNVPGIFKHMVILMSSSRYNSTVGLLSYSHGRQEALQESSHAMRGKAAPPGIRSPSPLPGRAQRRKERKKLSPLLILLKHEGQETPPPSCQEKPCLQTTRTPPSGRYTSKTSHSAWISGTPILAGDMPGAYTNMYLLHKTYRCSNSWNKKYSVTGNRS